jgi:hypothetical protein
MCPACVRPYLNGRFCPSCIDIASGGGVGGGGSVPWENERATLGTIGAWVKTAKAAAFNADEFFQRMPTEGPGIGPPMGFNVLGGSFFGFIGQLAVLVVMVAITSASGSASTAAAQLVPQTICWSVALPLLIVIGSLIMAALNHLVVLMCGGARGFETTFRILSYGTGAVSPLQAIPWVGALVAAVWNMYIMYFGYKHAQRLSPGKALICTLWPLFLGLICGGFLVVMVFMTAVSSRPGGGGGF